MVRALMLLSFMLSVPSNARAQNGGMFIYPQKDQSQAQQDKDRYECHRWAAGQTGFDSSVPYPSNPSALDPQPYQPSQRHVMKGAARGTALGAVGGAIEENAGKGAAAGAAMGGMAGGFRRMDERKQYENAQQQKLQAHASAQASQAASYQRAMAACLDDCGYSVK